MPVVIVDPGQYGALTAGTPVPPFPAAALAGPAAGTGGPGCPRLLSAAGRDILGSRGSLFVAARHDADPGGRLPGQHPRRTARRPVPGAAAVGPGARKRQRPR